MAAWTTWRRKIDSETRRSACPAHLQTLRKCGLRLEYPHWLWRAHSERGSTIVETALSLTILLTLSLGVMQMSLALYTYHFISDAAREGTRYAIVRGSSCSTNANFASACPAANTDVQTYVRGLGFPGINPSLLLVNTTWPTTGTTCTPSLTPCNNPGNLVKVVVTYQYPLSIPFLPARTLNMTSTSQMVISD